MPIIKPAENYTLKQVAAFKQRCKVCVTPFLLVLIDDRNQHQNLNVTLKTWAEHAVPESTALISLDVASAESNGHIKNWENLHTQYHHVSSDISNLCTLDVKINTSDIISIGLANKIFQFMGFSENGLLVPKRSSTLL